VPALLLLRDIDEKKCSRVIAVEEQVNSFICLSIACSASNEIERIAGLDAG
jgi:hypothetical protein